VGARLFTADADCRAHADYSAGYGIDELYARYIDCIIQYDMK
jgi:hypothetical protein